MDLDEIKEDINFLRNLKQMHIRRVRVLKLQQAEKGHNCPPEIIIEIEDIDIKIGEIDLQIRQNEQNLMELGKKISQYSDMIADLTERPISEIQDVLIDIRNAVDLILNRKEAENKR